MATLLLRVMSQEMGGQEDIILSMLPEAAFLFLVEVAVGREAAAVVLFLAVEFIAGVPNHTADIFKTLT